MSQIWHHDRENISQDQWNRTKLFFFNMLIWALLKALLIGAGVMVVKERKSNKEDKREMDAAAAALRVLNSVSQELNIFSILESSISTMGITGYDQVKQLMSSSMGIITSSSRDWFDLLNQMGAIKDF